jgi:hypothetical protein
MNQGTLVTCPECLLSGKRQILGSVNANGEFIILRFHHGTTMIKSSAYSIGCACGYLLSITLTQGVASYNHSRQQFLENGQN